MTTITPATTEHGPAPVLAVVPVKRLARAKTRLTLPERMRESVALAVALDTVAALVDTPAVRGVLVVSSDAVVAARLAALHPRAAGVRVVAEAGVGLRAAVHTGLLAARSWRPDLGVVVVPGDLPCLRPADVVEVLDLAAGRGRSFVPDRSATGTTLLALPPAWLGPTYYGADSAQRHADDGVFPLALAPTRARHDLDTLADLRSAADLGLGVHTAGVVGALGLVGVPLHESA